jgi:glucosyl-3-phosphoglycerate synthase
MTTINPSMRKMVVFEMDNILVQGKYIDNCAKRYNFEQALNLLRQIDKNKISLARRIGHFLKGKPVHELVAIADEMPLKEDIDHVTRELQQRGYVIGIISDSYQLVTQHIGKKIGASFTLSYSLGHTNEIATGEVSIPSIFYFNENSTCEHPVCKTNALRHVCKEYDVAMNNCIVIAGSENATCMKRHAGVGVELQELLEYAP